MTAASATAATATTGATAAEQRVTPDRPQVTELGSGLRVVSERIDTVRSIALGFWIRTGSRDETVPEAGVSHFLEHLLFKGTNRFSSTEID